MLGRCLELDVNLQLGHVNYAAYSGVAEQTRSYKDRACHNWLSQTTEREMLGKAVRIRITETFCFTHQLIILVKKPLQMGNRLTI